MKTQSPASRSASHHSRSRQPPKRRRSIRSTSRRPPKPPYPSERSPSALTQPKASVSICWLLARVEEGEAFAAGEHAVEVVLVVVVQHRARVVARAPPQVVRVEVRRVRPAAQEGRQEDVRLHLGRQEGDEVHVRLPIRIDKFAQPQLRRPRGARLLPRVLGLQQDVAEARDQLGVVLPARVRRHRARRAAKQQRPAPARRVRRHKLGGRRRRVGRSDGASAPRQLEEGGVALAARARAELEISACATGRRRRPQTASKVNSQKSCSESVAQLTVGDGQPSSAQGHGPASVRAAQAIGAPVRWCEQSLPRRGECTCTRTMKIT